MTESLTTSRARVVLYEGEGSRRLSPERRFDVARSLLESGFSVTRPSAGRAVTSMDATPLVVLGEFDTSIEVDGASAPVETRDIAGRAVEQVVDDVRETGERLGAKSPGGWKPWFPVIDYDRCTNCMQCLTFCLFDVYGVDQAQKLTVRNQSNCKTDCPACSRVCPEAAILFPKYKKGPINGDEVKEEDLKREAMKVDISALLGGDIYGALRQRQKEARDRFSTERDESRALLERKRCLKKLGQDLDIPPEVLMTLPSVEDIEERARRAKEKAAKRMERSQTVKDKKPPTPDEWGI